MKKKTVRFDREKLENFPCGQALNELGPVHTANNRAWEAAVPLYVL